MLVTHLGPCSTGSALSPPFFKNTSSLLARQSYLAHEREHRLLELTLKYLGGKLLADLPFQIILKSRCIANFHSVLPSCMDEYYNRPADDLYRSSCIQAHVCGCCTLVRGQIYYRAYVYAHCSHSLRLHFSSNFSIHQATMPFHTFDSTYRDLLQTEKCVSDLCNSCQSTPIPAYAAQVQLLHTNGLKD